MGINIGDVGNIFAASPALILSLLFFFTSAVHVLFGITSLFANWKSPINRAVSLLCAFLAVWAFGFSIATTAPDANTALFWRRFAAFGWSGMYSALLYFFVVLTRGTDRPAHRWIIAPIFLPAMILMLVFGVFPGMVHARLVYSDLGWVNIWETGVWDWFYYAYYIGYSTAGVFLLWRWGRRSGDVRETRQAHLLIGSLTAVFLIGTVTDNILATIRPGQLPQLAVIYTLVPVAVIYNATRRYGVFFPPEESSDSSATTIMNPLNRERIFRYLALVFLLGSFLNFAARYFLRREPFAAVFPFCSLLFGIGLLIWLIQRLSIEERYRDTISSVLVSAAIPLVTLNYLSVSSKTVWAAPFLFVILSVASNRRRLLAAVSAVTILSLLVVWVHSPVNEVRIDGVDHLARIGLFAVAMGMALYINQIYRSRLVESADQIAFRTTIAGISTALAAIDESNFDQGIQSILEQCSFYLKAAGGYLVCLSPDCRSIESTYVWNRDPTPSKIEIGDVTTPGENPAAVPATVPHLAAPVTRNGQTVGFLGFAGGQSPEVGYGDTGQMLQIVTNLVSDALERVARQEENRHLAFFDPLTDLPNRTLFFNRLDHAIKLARRNGGLIGVVFLDLDSFKAVNDSFGHDAGDRLLQGVAHKLTRQVRDHDTVSRFGGDEFLIMLTNVRKELDIIRKVEKLLQSFKSPVEVLNRTFHVGFSAGIAIFPVHAETSDALLKHADDAMYRSKKAGKNQYTVFS